MCVLPILKNFQCKSCSIDACGARDYAFLGDLFRIPEPRPINHSLKSDAQAEVDVEALPVIPTCRHVPEPLFSTELVSTSHSLGFHLTVF